MQFIFGMIDGKGCPRMVMGDANPALRDLTDLSLGSDSAELMNWGPGASEFSSLNVAHIILSAVASVEIANRYATQFGEFIRSERFGSASWLLLSKEVRSWIDRMIDKETVEQACPQQTN